MIQVTKANFQTEVLDFKGVVVVDFYADWCGPCKMLGPLLHSMSDSNKDPKVKFAKVNVDEAQDLAGQFDVMSIPTVIFFKDGKGVNQMVGVSDKSEYQNAINEAMAQG